VIPVRPAPEPSTFDERVRRPGLDAIAEMVGEAPVRLRPGPKRERIAATREAIPAARLPDFWKHALDDMMSAYGQICAYTAMYIDRVTGARSVDHLIPKSKTWNLVYEWSNYRLACSRINAKKCDLDLMVDPFTIVDRTFALELVGFQVRPGPGATAANLDAIERTIRDLGLNSSNCLQRREVYVAEYEATHIDLDYLTRHAPFIAYELRRQGRLRPGDV
jgi:hypothetical protein